MQAVAARSLDVARDPGTLTHSTPAQGHPEPVERMSLSNGRAGGRFQIHSLALGAILKLKTQ
jgi:hypothetical protein